MAKLKALLGAPKDFPLTVTMQDLEGKDVDIEFTAIGRTLESWHPLAAARYAHDAEMLAQRADDAAEAVAKAEAKPADDAKKPAKRKKIEVDQAEMAKNLQKGMDDAASVIQEVASGWALDDEFNPDNLKRLIAQYPGVQQKLWNEYDRRVRGDRTKN